MKNEDRKLENMNASKEEIQLWIRAVNQMIVKYQEENREGIGEPTKCLMCETSIKVKRNRYGYEGFTHVCFNCPICYFPDKTNSDDNMSVHCVGSSNFQAVTYEKDCLLLSKAFAKRVKFYKSLKSGLQNLLTKA